MDHHAEQRWRRRARRVARCRVLAPVRALSLTVLLTTVVVNGGAAEPPSRAADHQRSQRAAPDHRCRVGGAVPEHAPASALIRTTLGALRQVSFEVGWEVYNGRRPGTLVAVCLGSDWSRAAP